MAKIYLALGSNVGDSKQHLNTAIGLLSKSLDQIRQAPFYRSRAVGYTAQADFINTVVSGNTSLTPQELMVFTKKTEQKVGRIRRFRWGPREIDIDIIFYDNQIVSEPDLHIPHARFAERDFVLKPLCDLGPELVDPLSKLTVTQLYEKIPKDARSIY